jgi:hypothetical protein
MVKEPERRPVPEGAAVFPLIPEDLEVHPLLLVVLHAVVFVEGSDEKIVQADAALEALDQVGTYLQRLRGLELRRVREDMECLVGYARQQKWSKEQIEFLKNFLTEFGVGREGEA